MSNSSTNTSGTLTWANNDAVSRTFTVGIIDNLAINTNKTVNLQLSGITGGALAGLTSAVLTIVENDSLVSFSTNAYTVAETGTNAVITIVRSGATSPFASPS